MTAPERWHGRVAARYRAARKLTMLPYTSGITARSCISPNATHARHARAAAQKGKQMGCVADWAVAKTRESSPLPTDEVAGSQLAACNSFIGRSTPIDLR